ncbi:MAG: hypothetical protein JSU98_10065 [Gemmatimonadales bacterium]|nr:MAG: hypothetical protein JSU98_10065 [Gemmatimonadales bacterium]
MFQRRAPLGRAPHASLSALFLAALVAVPTSGGAQEQEALTRAVEGLEFREIGPAIMGGRVADLAIHEDDPALWYVGFATGGLWRTRNHGMTWEPLFDDQEVASIGAVALAPSNPNVIWVGTGEPQNRQSSPYGGGVFRSLDGGRSWAKLGLEETRHVGRIVVHPGNPEVAWVAAVGHLWGPNEERGVYRTTDGGTTWERVLYVDEHTGAIDLAMDPGDPNTLFAAMYQRRRTVFGFSASGGGSGLYRTLDGGTSWQEMTEGLPDGDKGRMGVDVHRGNGDLVYLTVEGASPGDRGLYRSTDRGESWERVSGNNPRPMYFSMVRIDPGNPDRIYMGGVDLQVSDDGGRTWWDYDGYTEIHVDYHALWVDPNDSDHVVVGNDGGVASTWDGGRSWRHHNNLAVGQFYEIGVDMRDPYYVCGGLQDNSSWCGPSNKLDSYGIANRDWYDVSGGDGFYNQVDPTDWRWVYTESQGGNISRYNAETGETAGIRPLRRPEPEEAGSAEEGEEDEDYAFNWNAPIVVSRHDPATIYIGADHLMRSRDRGQRWEEASPDLTTGIDRDTLTIFGRALSEPHLSRNDGISRYGTITTVDESPLDPELLWVGTDDGRVHVTRDGGGSWTEVSRGVPGLPGRRYVSRIEASMHVEGRAYLTFDGHYDDDYSPYVYVTENFGEDWRRITAGLPNHSVNVVREHPETEALLFVGTEVGLHVSVDRGARWHRLKANLPTVPVDDLVIHPRDNDLVVGTHGRSIWILDDLAPLQEMAADVVSRAAHLFPVRRATLWSRAGGWPFWGDLFFGENPPDGALVRLHFADSIPADSAALVVIDAAGDTVRSLEVSGEAGLTTVVWDLRYDDPYPSEGEEAGGRFGPPRGPTVLPGRYRVHLRVGEMEASREVEVRLDPRVETTPEALEARQAALMDAHALAAPLREAQSRIRELRDRLREADELLEDHEMAPRALRQTVEELLERVDEVSDELGDANSGVRVGRAVQGSFGPPTADQRWQLDRAWEVLPGVVEEVNRILTVDMPELYRELDRRGIREELSGPMEVPRRPGG